VLVLTRNVGQTVIIDDHIIVTVIGVQGGNVRLGIEAPKHIPVHRLEVQERIDREKGND